MGWIITSIIFIAIITLIIFLIMKMIIDAQLKKARRNYNDDKNESRRPEIQDVFERNREPDVSEPKPEPATKHERREFIPDDTSLCLREDEPELREHTGTKVNKKSFRSLFRRK